MVKRVLMIAFHYPPLCGGSGVHRTEAFAKYLPQFGWQPQILTASPRAYGLSSAEPAANVCRSLALDTSRHLAIRGRYPAWLAQPDRWISWWPGAVLAGLAQIRAHRPDAIWSTYPIATAHLIGLTLHKLTGLPWIADQRDPMTDIAYPPDPLKRRIHAWIERKAARHASALVCTTPSAADDMGQRFPRAANIQLIENGYDEADFQQAKAALAPRATGHVFRLLHSGVIYPSERDPAALFAALTQLARTGEICADNFRLILRATGHDDHLRVLLRRGGIEHLVELGPSLPYHAALAEMMSADGLLLLQAANCNGQIPAKLYEYLRAKRPLLALTDPSGDTASALFRAGIGTMARLDSVSDITVALRHFLHLCRAGKAPLAPDEEIARHSRLARTRELASLLDRIHRKESP